MNKIVSIYLIVTLITIETHSQNMTFAFKGFENIKIGDSMEMPGFNIMHPIKQSRIYSSLSLSYIEMFEYYYLDSITVVLNKKDSILFESIFIGVNKTTNILEGITILVDKKKIKPILSSINSLYDSEKLKSTSWAGYPESYSNILWNRNGVSLHMREESNNPYIKINISDGTPELKVPSVYIYKND